MVPGFLVTLMGGVAAMGGGDAVSMVSGFLVTLMGGVAAMGEVMP